MEYHKINGIYKRYIDGEKKGQFIIGDWSQPEFNYLQNNDWEWSEKIDGMNIRINWNLSQITFEGRTDKAEIPTNLKSHLINTFTEELFQTVFPESNVILFGEGYGKKIQSCGSVYLPSSTSFILFDVMVLTEGRGWWLKREDVNDVATKMRIDSVPIVGHGTIVEAIEFVKKGFQSRITENPLIAEGLVIRPTVDLFARNGQRIITKIKYKDFLI